MNGRTLMIGLGVLLVIFTPALWYFQTYAYYQELPQQPLIIQGTEYPVETWQGIDAISSPLKIRICLTVTEQTAQRIADEQSEQAGGEPLVAPSWFECFDAKALSRDIAAGKARVFAPGTSPFEDVDDYLALYPDGRGYFWRQLGPEMSGK